MELDKNTRFDNAIIDDPQFVNYIMRFTSKVPHKIKNKKELKTKLEERKLSQADIEMLLQSAKLPN